MNKRSSLTRYSFSGESPRWWWPSATAGVAATLAVAAIVGSSSAGSAIPVDTDRYGTPTEVSVHVPARPNARAPFHSQDDIPPGFRQCFMWQPHWNETLGGPQPWCPIDRPEPNEDGDRRSRGADEEDGAGATSRDLTAFSLLRGELTKPVPIP